MSVPVHGNEGYLQRASACSALATGKLQDELSSLLDQLQDSVEAAANNALAGVVKRLSTLW